MCNHSWEALIDTSPEIKDREGMKDALETRRRHADAVTSARLRMLRGDSRDAESDSTDDDNTKSLKTLPG